MRAKNYFMRRIPVAVAAAFISLPALTADYSCDGPVNGVTVGPSGVVSAASAGGQSWGYFCQVNGTTNGISPEACRGMLAVLLTAQATGKQVRIWFRDDFNSCSTPRGWAWLSTIYWGPALID